MKKRIFSILLIIFIFISTVSYRPVVVRADATLSWDKIQLIVLALISAGVVFANKDNINLMANDINNKMLAQNIPFVPSLVNNLLTVELTQPFINMMTSYVNTIKANPNLHFQTPLNINKVGSESDAQVLNIGKSIGFVVDGPCIFWHKNRPGYGYSGLSIVAGSYTVTATAFDSFRNYMTVSGYEGFLTDMPGAFYINTPYVQTFTDANFTQDISRVSTGVSSIPVNSSISALPSATLDSLVGVSDVSTVGTITAPVALPVEGTLTGVIGAIQTLINTVTGTVSTGINIIIDSIVAIPSLIAAAISALFVPTISIDTTRISNGWGQGVSFLTSYSDQPFSFDMPFAQSNYTQRITLSDPNFKRLRGWILAMMNLSALVKCLMVVWTEFVDLRQGEQISFFD